VDVMGLGSITSTDPPIKIASRIFRFSRKEFFMNTVEPMDKIHQGDKTEVLELCEIQNIAINLYTETKNPKFVEIIERTARLLQLKKELLGVWRIEIARKKNGSSEEYYYRLSTGKWRRGVGGRQDIYLGNYSSMVSRIMKIERHKKAISNIPSYIEFGAE